MQVQFNKNYEAQPHRDFNGGASVLLVGGAFSGGEIQVGGRVYNVDLPLVFDGRQIHAVLPFLGLRVSLVLYYDGACVPLSALVARGPDGYVTRVRRAGQRMRSARALASAERPGKTSRPLVRASPQHACSRDSSTRYATWRRWLRRRVTP